MIEELLELDATINALSDRHPEIFAGNLWRELRVALFWLRTDCEGRV